MLECGDYGIRVKCHGDVFHVVVGGGGCGVDVDAWTEDPPAQIHALFRLDVNEYRGARTLQLVIQSFWRL